MRYTEDKLTEALRRFYAGDIKAASAIIVQANRLGVLSDYCPSYNVAFGPTSPLEVPCGNPKCDTVGISWGNCSMCINCHEDLCPKPLEYFGGDNSAWAWSERNREETCGVNREVMTSPYLESVLTYSCNKLVKWLKENKQEIYYDFA